MRWLAWGQIIVLAGGVALVPGDARAQDRKPSGPPEPPRDLPLAIHGPEKQFRPMRVAVAGLVHGHVDGFLASAVKRTDLEIVGVAEPDRKLFDTYARKYGLDPKRYYPDLEELLDHTQPEADAVLVYTSTFDHRRVVETCARYARYGLGAVMMEKPLAVSAEDAHEIGRLSVETGLKVLVNYETTWYRSNRGAEELVRSGAIGQIRKVVVHDGHRGPKEIGVGPEFLSWLTDPGLDGGGALYDFGCYGADLMTWLMNGERPVSVTAVTQTIKPDVYPKVDDEATIVLTYPRAQAILQASWNWPFDRKDMEVYGQTGYVKTIKRDEMEVRLAGETEAKRVEPKLIAPPEDDPLHYLRAVVLYGKRPEGLGSLEVNVVVAEILDAARESATTGKTIKTR